MVGQRHVIGIWLLAPLSAGIKNNTRDTVGGRVSGWHKKTK